MSARSITDHPTDEIESDVWHLHHLLATLVDLMQEELHMDRISALLWIARDMSETIGHDMTALNSTITGGRK
jgi:hypothetical protein